jgi:hypothetical protein
MDKNNLPCDYEPFHELIVCTNTLLNGKVPIEIEGHVPFLVGKGDIPQIWLSVPGPNGQWIELVVSNKRVEKKSPAFKQYLLTIEESLEERRVDISMWKTNILSAIKETEQKAIVTNLDLRPFNLLIFGDAAGLHIGGQLLRGNTVSNVHTMIGIGQ